MDLTQVADFFQNCNVFKWNSVITDPDLKGANELLHLFEISQVFEYPCQIEYQNGHIS
jgi:hypothetical protein